MDTFNACHVYMYVTLCSIISPRLTYSDIPGTPSGIFHQEVKLVQSIRSVTPRKKLREINSTTTVTSKRNTDHAKYVLTNLCNPCNVLKFIPKSDHLSLVLIFCPLFAYGFGWQ